MRLEAWGESNIGLVRQTNQDSIGCFPEAELFIVADGMGGRAEGGVASALAVETLRTEIDPAGGDGAGQAPRWRLFGLGRAGKAEPAGRGRVLEDAIRVANQRIYVTGQQQLSAESSQRGSMGTTVVALACDLDQQRAHWAHVGDSRLYRVRRGAVMLLTADHTIPGEAYVEAAAVPLDLPHTNRLTRALGIAPEVQVASGGDSLLPGDLFCLCSDGISGMVEPSALRDQLLGDGGIEAIGAALIRAALAGGGRDNASVLLVRAHGD